LGSAQAEEATILSHMICDYSPFSFAKIKEKKFHICADFEGE
jgi:hypothetical protein